jgi:putative ABC transport system ATP-binding protein
LPESSTPVIEVNAGTKTLTLPDGSHLQLLIDLDLRLESRSSCAIMGASGSGKTTLLRILALFDEFDSGCYRMMGEDMSQLSDRRRSMVRAGRIGFVFQDFRLLPGLTALENVEYACLLGPFLRKHQRRKAAADVLERVGLEHRMASRPSQLSGGEKQRVAIARALVRRPALVLADEPTGALDRKTGQLVLGVLLDAVRDQGAALMMATHNLDVAVATENVVQLEDGRLHRVHDDVSC